MLYSRKEAVLHDVRPLQIHGAPFCDIVFAYTEQLDPRPESARIGGEMIYPQAQAGDRVLIERIANVVVRVERL